MRGNKLFPLASAAPTDDVRSGLVTGITMATSTADDQTSAWKLYVTLNCSGLGRLHNVECELPEAALLRTRAYRLALTNCDALGHELARSRTIVNCDAGTESNRFTRMLVLRRGCPRRTTSRAGWVKPCVRLRIVVGFGLGLP